MRRCHIVEHVDCRKSCGRHGSLRTNEWRAYDRKRMPPIGQKAGIPRSHDVLCPDW